MRIKHVLLCGLCLAAGSLPQLASAQTRPVLLRDSFPIGSGDGVLCQVQDRSAENPARRSAFDRAWAVVCRDSAQPVATVHAFSGSPADPAALTAPHRRESVECGGGFTILGDGISRQDCTVAGTQLGWSVLRAERGGTSYVAQGYTAYDSATMLALRSVIENKVAEGRIDAATTSVGDPNAFARVQAESLRPEQALTEGYRRNLAGEYAEASAYFETLQYRLEREGDESIHPSEFILNRALQKSNLGDFGEAERLFDEVRGTAAGDAIGERLLRNFEAIHLLNRGYHEQVAPRLAQPLGTAIDPVSQDAETVRISVPIAQRLNSQARGGLIGFASETTLTESERAQIIDAQALQIAGSAARLMGDGARAREALLEAQQRAMAVRAGRVTTILRMRSQILGDLGLLAESGGNPDEAERYLRASVDLLQTQYPERSAVSGAQARLASYLLRNGQEAEGLAAYEEVVERTLTRGGGGTGFVNLMRPYYRHLAQRADNDPQAASRFFRAAQLLVRPGIAETQAVFARELSAGSDEASRLFRQSTDLAREVEQLRVRYLALTRAEQTAEVAMRANEFKQRIESLEQAQLRTQAQLADFPQYRAVANRAIGLDEFQSLLRPGEAYARLAVAGSDLFMVWSTADRARVWKVPMRQQDLDFLVDMLRASISVQEGDRYVTYPFDLDSSHELFGKLFGPVAADLGAIDHLIFEPDGAMLRLPADLLVADAASLARYETQAAIDEYDFTGVEWLGRDRRISTAVSAQGFADARRAPSSAAAREYIGFGQNQPLGETTVASTRGAIVSGSDSCGWGIATWNQPIDASELWVARSIVGEGASEIETGASFTDTAIKTRQDLDQFRILHFATHGLVTPPHPRCSVQPALLTSFGGEGSDGLLSFDEIFDLDLDADVVILSACDTAAGASIEATREAGLTTGGGTALDGLVRAFVGAGGRTVLASHWPAPDDYRATERLVSEMFRAGQTMPLGAALKQSQHALMDEAVTSHPYYWAGFALVGDGASTQLSRSPQGSAGEAE